MTARIDVHQHLVPPPYRDALRAAGLTEVGGRALPDWSPESALALMDETGIATGVLSVSAPGTTFLPDPGAAITLARKVNEYGAALVEQNPHRFGHFATVPMPDVDAATAEAVHALDTLHADGVVLLANSRGTYLGAEGQEKLFAALDERNALAFVHPADLPGPAVPGIVPFAADFLLDTTRAAYLLVRNGIVRRYPKIRFVLSHAGGFVPYAAHRMAMGLANDGHSIRDTLTDLRTFYFDTALSASPTALPALLAFARPERILFGSDWPFAPDMAVHYFATGLEEHLRNTPFGTTISTAIDHGNAAALFPRLARETVAPAQIGRASALRGALKTRVIRALFKIADPARG
ncbi:amidohydrolase family protein [Amycolatopsis jiangsuensis]|uniref:Putative TIM-barrel fold metal-dependent hydrolase n=1 Tax=Amycolatopsis jiangsuensis TaxID=1181879 RepID=A0A840J7U8_9PSEU|nr:amidohydrolase family protein [Amycolatopsis jiangsuensis]MBB4689534.1 putative TIM-barrel fold metal-dependent hydrolase [Amycolatopsis jiangsuensis]